MVSDPVRVAAVAGTPDEARALADGLERADAGLSAEPAVPDDLPADLDEGVECVVADHAPPGIDALDLFETVRDSFPTLAFVLFPSEGSESLAADTVAAGVTDYVPRGDEDDYTDLAARVREAVGAERALRGDSGGEGATDRLRDRNERLAELAERYETAQERYRTLFEYNPIAIWEEDASAAKAYVDELAAEVGDLGAYFDDHPEELEHVFELIDVIDVNERALEYYGADSKEQLLSGFDQLMTDESFESNKEFWASVADGETKFRIETVVRTLDGRRIDELFEARVPDSHADDYSRIFITGMDITERKERERELERQNERLDEFAAIVSHDLRNPLTVAQGWLELAAEECDSDALGRADDAIDRSLTLVEDLLTLAREGKTVDEYEPVALGTLARECWGTVTSTDVTLESVPDVTVMADRGRLRQLLENLFRNTVEHGGSGVTIRVGTLAGGFFVADDGPGIPADEREQVFEPGRTSKPNGTGFGLDIVRRIAEAHGWTVAATESESGGARFEFTGVEFDG